MKLYLIIVQDKDLSDEPDIGFTVVEGNELAAQSVMKELERKYLETGHVHCIARYQEILRGHEYKASMLIEPYIQHITELENAIDVLASEIEHADIGKQSEGEAWRARQLLSDPAKRKHR